MKNLLYYILNLTFPKFEKKIIELLKNEKKLVIFDVGCYRGVFVKTILRFMGQRRYKFFLFDINKNVKKYIMNLLKLKNIHYHEIALSNKNGTAMYNYNSSFESSGSSLSSIYKNDTKWINSRKFILKILSPNTKEQGFIKYRVQTITLDNFLKKNKIKLIDVLKIDIDGYEHKFLQGAKNALNNNKIKTILIEISDKKNLYHKKEKKILNFLQKRNFVFIKKSNIFTVSIFSNTKCGDYLFVNNKYWKEGASNHS